METASSIFRAIAEFFGWRRQRDAAQNTAPMQAAQKGRDEAAAQKKTADAIANHDTTEIQNELAE